MATKTLPCIALYKATGDPRENVLLTNGSGGTLYCLVLKLQLGNNGRKSWSGEICHCR